VDSHAFPFLYINIIAFKENNLYTYFSTVEFKQPIIRSKDVVVELLGTPSNWKSETATPLPPISRSSILDLIQNKNIFAITWQNGKVGTVGRVGSANVQQIRNVVKDLVDLFLNDWLKVNKKPWSDARHLLKSQLGVAPKWSSSDSWGGPREPFPNACVPSFPDPFLFPRAALFPVPFHFEPDWRSEGLWVAVSKVKYAEDRCAGSNSQCERKRRDSREARVLAKHAEGVAEILPEHFNR
jgi:hypothetical protein